MGMTATPAPTHRTGTHTAPADEITDGAMTRSRFRRLALVTSLTEEIGVVEAQARAIKAFLLAQELLRGGYSVAEITQLPATERKRIAAKAEILKPSDDTWAWATNMVDACQDRARR